MTMATVTVSETNNHSANRWRMAKDHAVEVFYGKLKHVRWLAAPGVLAKLLFPLAYLLVTRQWLMHQAMPAQRLAWAWDVVNGVVNMMFLIVVALPAMLMFVGMGLEGFSEHITHSLLSWLMIVGVIVFVSFVMHPMYFRPRDTRKTRVLKIFMTALFYAFAALVALKPTSMMCAYIGAMLKIFAHKITLLPLDWELVLTGFMEQIAEKLCRLNSCTGGPC